MVPLIIIGAESTPRPPATFNSGVGWVGSGKSQLRPRCWAFELLITICGLWLWLSALPPDATQFASRAGSGVAARAADAGMGDAKTGGPANDEKTKRRLRHAASIDALLDAFDIAFDVCCSRKYLPVAHILTFREPRPRSGTEDFLPARTHCVGLLAGQGRGPLPCMPASPASSHRDPSRGAFLTSNA